MARLKRRLDGAYYIVGRLPEDGICTWQLTATGVAHLVASGYSPDAQITPDMLDLLRRTAMIFTGGTGPGSIDPLPEPGSMTFSGSRPASVRSGCMGCGCLGGSLAAALLGLVVVLI